MTDAIAANFAPGLARPALRALAAAGYTDVKQLAKVPDQELLSLHGFGPNAIKIIRAAHR